MSCPPHLFGAAFSLALSALTLLGAAAEANPALVTHTPAVGYQTLSMPDPEGPPVDVAVWYPADGAGSPTSVGPFTQTLSVQAPMLGNDLPLVVISHGNGGSFASHSDTALALAQAGFVVAALTHTGDSYRDQSRATDLPNRPRQLKLLVDYMLGVWPQRNRIDPARIGAFGFSSGGFTVLVAAGGEPDLRMMADHCHEHPDYYDCRLMARGPTQASTAPVWTHDRRLKAAVSAAPAMGFSFGQAGLAGVSVPIQLWRASDDHILPNPDYAEAVRLSLPTPSDYRVVANADHFDFLAPCSDILKQSAPMICTSAPGFDRTRFHEAFNRDVVAFFRAKLAG
jgi:predicted dienelactone hydrolase